VRCPVCGADDHATASIGAFDAILCPDAPPDTLYLFPNPGGSPPVDTNDIRHRFAYHPPRTDDVKRRHEQVRELLGDVAGVLNGLLPDGREKSLTITHLEDAMMWANAAIARHHGQA
jgi:hypothetical protein